MIALQLISVEKEFREERGRVITIEGRSCVNVEAGFQGVVEEGCVWEESKATSKLLSSTHLKIKGRPFLCSVLYVYVLVVMLWMGIT